MHDFRLFKNSKIPLTKTIKCLVDKGYQGIQKLRVEPGYGVEQSLASLSATGTVV
jgi:hypothetical protein